VGNFFAGSVMFAGKFWQKPTSDVGGHALPPGLRSLKLGSCSTNIVCGASESYNGFLFLMDQMFMDPEPKDFRCRSPKFKFRLRPLVATHVLCLAAHHLMFSINLCKFRS